MSNGDNIWRHIALFLGGVVVTLCIVWFTHVKDAATKGDIQVLTDKLAKVSENLVEVRTRLDMIHPQEKKR